jgi:hypothetical protein
MKDFATITYAGCSIEIEGTYFDGEFSSFNMTGATLLKGDLLDLIESARSNKFIISDMETLALDQLDKQKAA